MKTKEEVLRYVKNTESAVLMKRFSRIMDGYATLDGFFRASRSDLMNMYAKARPGSHIGLGESFWRAYDKAKYFYANSVDGNADEPKTVAPAPQGRDNPVHERMFSLEELQTIVAFMDLCGVEAINLRHITEFFSAVKLSPKKKPGSDAEPKDDNAPKDDMTCQAKA